MFDGVVVSDWGGVHDTKDSVFNGLDMEFGSWTNGLNWGASNAYDNYYLANPYLRLLKEGKVGTKELDDKVRRILRLVFRTNMSKDRPLGTFGTEDHALAGRKIAQEGIVLLKNEASVLPIESGKIKKIVIVGENAAKAMTIGGGSSSLKVKYEVSPLAGIKQRAGKDFEVNYATGYTSNAEDNQDKLRIEAVEAAKNADIVLFIGGLNKEGGQDAEGSDRQSLNLSYGQDRLIEELAAVNPHTVVILVSGNAVAMPWIKQVPGILQAWYGGTEAGNAIASILFGDVNPSGKLPFTFPARLEDNGAIAMKAYPGDSIDVSYDESIFVGYRWTDKQKKVKPLFPFGHGLSYTTFEYGKLIADKKVMSVDETITFSLTVKNTGNREGQEIVQLYIRDIKSSLPRPVKELKRFKKVKLMPGEEKIVSLSIDKEALSFFDAERHEWICEPGKFEAIIAASAMDIKDVLKFELK